MFDFSATYDMIGTVYEMFNSVIINIIIFLRRSTMDFEAIKKAAAAYGPDMTRFLRDIFLLTGNFLQV